MIVSYETLRSLTAHLANCSIGLLLCDEGHRLKNSESLTFQALNGLNVKRRVILSGTPIQVRYIHSGISRWACLTFRTERSLRILLSAQLRKP